MSLGIAFKGPEGIVLAADSRITITTKTGLPEGQVQVTQSAYDNATKLLRSKQQTHVGAITYGMGAIPTPSPRSAHSFMPEFDAWIATESRLSVEDFAKKLSQFFLDQFTLGGNQAQPGNDMFFFVGGYDLHDTFGKIFEFRIPNAPTPVERHHGAFFGAVWGGQHEYVDRLVNGFDTNLPTLAQTVLGLTEEQKEYLSTNLATNFGSNIPWVFLPLQDCIDLTIFLIRATITMQQFLIGIRGVGGAIDVAVITQAEGVKELRKKQLSAD